MNTVWIFGDSFSVDYDKNPIGSFKEYIKLKGYSPKTYGIHSFPTRRSSDDRKSVV